MLPKISVVTVTLNDCDALRSTRASIVEQSYAEIEHVIVDGGSSDDTLNFLQAADRESSSLQWVSEPDRGIYDAMNKGVQLSSGQWVIFLNAGDTFFNNDVVVEIFQKQQPCSDLIYGDTVFVEGESQELIRARDLSLLWQAMVFNHNSLFTRRSVLLEHPFVDEYRIVADSEFVIWARQSEKTFHYSGTTVNNYPRGGFSDTHSVLRTVERWKLVIDRNMKPENVINDYYFQRLLWEESCQSYLKEQYKISVQDQVKNNFPISSCPIFVIPAEAGIQTCCGP